MNMKRVEEITDKFYEFDHNLTEEEQDLALTTIKQQHDLIEKYKKALKFYGDKKTYNLKVEFSMGTAFPKHEPIKYDKGELARKALEES